jgi:uncharacterized protein with PIN domain
MQIKCPPITYFNTNDWEGGSNFGVQIACCQRQAVLWYNNHWAGILKIKKKNKKKKI